MAETNSASQKFSLPERASHLMQMKLESRDGSDIGRLRNFALDLRSGQLKFVVFSSGGYLGLGSKLHAVPPEFFSTATTKRDVLALNLPTARLNRAPVFKASELASLAKLSKQNEIAGFYYSLNTEPMIATAAEPFPLSLTPTGTTTNNPAMSLRLASDLLGQSVVDRDRHKLGEVLDLLLSFDPGAPVLVLISTGKFFHSRGPDYVVPLQALRLTDDRRVMINASRREFENARPFSEDGWHDVTSRTNAVAVFRYFTPR